MNCLHCGEPLKEKNVNCWHDRCVKEFFGVSNFPDIDLDANKIKDILKENIERRITVPGVQKKMSLRLSTDKGAKLTLVDYPTGYILKLQSEEYDNLPEAEFLVMRMAQKTGIKTVPFGLIKVDDEYAYITRRIDRGKMGEKFAMEDFCQLDGRLTISKYIGSYEQVGKILQKYSVRAQLDLVELFLRLVFSFVVGNSDMHLKNFSIIDKGGGYTISDAYDLLPAGILVDGDNEDMALMMGGKNKNLSRRDFLDLADRYGLTKKTGERMIFEVTKRKELYLDMASKSLLENNTKEALTRLIIDRINKLSEV